MVKKRLKQIFTDLGEAGIKERARLDVLREGAENATALIEAVRDQKYKIVPHIGDDYLPDIQQYNALGAIYPLLSRGQKDMALRALFRQFDSVRCDRVQLNHTKFIREPLMFGDICNARSIYFPGLSEGIYLIEQNVDFENFKRTTELSDGLFGSKKVISDHLVASAAIRTDTSPFSSQYAKACNPDFLDRLVHGLTAHWLGRIDPSEKEKIKDAKKLLPEELHSLVDEHYKTRDWADAGKFP